MTRANNNGWDFIEKNGIYQYKEDSMILIVKILENNSTDTHYKFTLHPIAGNIPFDKDFNVTHVKEPGGHWSGMQQFYEAPVYIPMPPGTPWPHIMDDEFYEWDKQFIIPQ